MKNDFFHLILTDTDECALANGGCEHSCSNADGSYTCSCNSGFKLKANGLTCDLLKKNQCPILGLLSFSSFSSLMFSFAETY